MRMRPHYFAMGLLVAAVGLVAMGVSAASLPETQVLDQWKTGVQHTKFSQDYSNMKEITTHLQHVVNCIEGQTGPGFEGGAGNPCQGQGNGMVVDAKKAGGKFAQTVWALELADSIAKAGLKAKSVDAAKTYGWSTQIVLEAVGGQLR